MTVWDGGSSDTYDFGDFTGGLTIDLRASANVIADHSGVGNSLAMLARQSPWKRGTALHKTIMYSLGFSDGRTGTLAALPAEATPYSTSAVLGHSQVQITREAAAPRLTLS